MDSAPDAPPRSVADRVAAVRARIDAAARAAGRDPASVTLIAVGKTRDAGALAEAADAGVTDFGENYLQEALEKQDALADRGLVWHFIGALQSNKTRPVAEHFDWVHTVDRAKIARRLDEQRPADRPPLNVCLQVNLDDETRKAGVAPQDAGALLDAVAALPRLRVRGLMAIPAPREDTGAQRAALERLAALAAELAPRADAPLDVLSMGMSDDLDAAVAAGATHVRIGTALFGPRAPKTTE
jgi:pyridoxal phosphate enzyme (YggS family)